MFAQLTRLFRIECRFDIRKEIDRSTGGDWILYQARAIRLEPFMLKQICSGRSIGWVDGEATSHEFSCSVGYSRPILRLKKTCQPYFDYTRPDLTGSNL